MKDSKKTGSQVTDEQLLELVKLFEGFTQASSSFTQSYRKLEQQIIHLSDQLQNQSKLLHRTEVFLSSVLSNIPVGIIVIDLDGVIAMFNPYSSLITGWRENEVIGKRYDEIFHSESTSPDSAFYTLITGSIIESREKSINNKDGEIVPVRFSTSWLRDNNNDSLGVLEIIEDLSPIKNLQRQMQRHETLASLGEMAAQVAHELRNPLAGVQGFAQFLMEDLEEEHPAYRTASKIVQGVHDIDHIAGDLLEFTRPISADYEKVNIIELLQSETELLQSELKNQNKSITITLNIPEETIDVECDSYLFKQAILNLLKNAANAIEFEGEITVSLVWNLMKNRYRIYIEDTGHGIPEDSLDKIFHPFYTTRSKGTGLGLAMVKKILHVHDGDIEVESKVGEGSLFTLELPITRLA